MLQIQTEREMYQIPPEPWGGLGQAGCSYSSCNLSGRELPLLPIAQFLLPHLQVSCVLENFPFYNYQDFKIVYPFVFINIMTKEFLNLCFGLEWGQDSKESIQSTCILHSFSLCVSI